MSLRTIFDKFLRRGERATLRRLVSPLAGALVTRADVVFEDLLEAVSGVTVIHDTPVLAGGWFRAIALRRAH